MTGLRSLILALRFVLWLLLPASAMARAPTDIVEAADAGVVCDGRLDVGPALQAIIDRSPGRAPAVIRLPAGTCLLNTPVTIRRAVHLVGVGSPEVGSVIPGTTLRTENTAITPVTITSTPAGGQYTSGGTEISDLTLEQAQPPPGPHWAPIPYPAFFRLRGAPGVRFRNISGYGIYAGIDSDGSGRLDVQGFNGQFFGEAVRDDHSYDNDTFVGMHIWPFWSSDPAVISWQQQHTDALHLYRVDGPFMDRIFVFAARSGLRLDRSSAGTPSKLQLGSIDFDSVVHGLWVTSGTNITMQVANLVVDGQLGTDSGKPAPGADAIEVDEDAGIVIQMGNLQSDLTDQHVIALLSHRNRSIVRISTLFARDLAGGSGDSVVYAARTAPNLPHDVAVATTPIIAASGNLPMMNLTSTDAILSVPGRSCSMELEHQAGPKHHDLVK